jgi:hypothetical protein
MTVAEATCGARPFHLVAHDWGSIQCWEAVTDPANAARLASYTSISGPCLDHVFRAPTNFRQTLKSWYIAFFHLPLVPQLVWRLGGAAPGRGGCARPKACAPNAIRSNCATA